MNFRNANWFIRYCDFYYRRSSWAIIICTLLTAHSSAQQYTPLVASSDSECALLLEGPGRTSAFDYNLNALRGTLLSIPPLPLLLGDISRLELWHLDNLEDPANGTLIFIPTISSYSQSFDNVKKTRPSPWFSFSRYNIGPFRNVSLPACNFKYVTEFPSSGEVITYVKIL